ncbi:hypothetical protein BgAZ_200580 [Babesia gibsoni]|uniref:Vacuolar protein sorting-associated protein 16 homolog n=1 Tax=Babesia gibsoni TaxID=33632 RepID=A0AAD8LKC9_BABGI|nr:hypothetical protein BgAZ_200580 [Babesia gibsoni]
MKDRIKMQNWHAVGELKLHRDAWSVSNVQWRLYQGDVCTVAPLGALVGILSNTMDANKSYPSNVKCHLRIFNGSTCETVTTVPWSVRMDTLLSLQWSDSMLLAAVFENACVRVFSGNGDLMHHFYLFFKEENAKATHIASSMVTLNTWGGGVVYVSKETRKLYLQHGFESVDCVNIDVGEYAEKITAMGVIPNEDFRKCIIVFTTDDGVFSIPIGDVMKCKSQEQFTKFITPINLSRNAVYNKVSACSHPAPGASEIYFALHNTETGGIASIKYKNGIIEALWEDVFEGFSDVYIVGDGVLALEGGMKITFTLGNTQVANFGINPIAVSSEVGGGIRVFTSKTVEFYKMVSRSMERVFEQGPFDPAAMLVKTYEMFNESDVKACDSLRMIRNDIEEAVETCLDAAEESWDISTAALLLNTALFGRYASSVCKEALDDPLEEEKMMDAVKGLERPPEDETIPSKEELDKGHSSTLKETVSIETTYLSEEDVSDRCRRAISLLRVVRGIKDHQCHIRTNISQLLAFGTRALVILLSAIRCHFLAIRIAGFLGIGKKDILLNWVRTRVKLGGYMTDGELVEAIIKTIGSYAGVVVPYSDIAIAVAKEKRETLALALLDKERCMLKRFRVMCKWKELKKAASIAADACNPLFAAYVIQEATDGANLEKIVDIANNNTFIRDLFIKQCKLNKDYKLLQLFYERTDDIMKAGLNAVNQSLVYLHREEPEERPIKSSMQQLFSHFSNRKDENSEDHTTWLSFASSFFDSISTSKNKYKPTVVENAKIWKDRISQQMALIDAQVSLEKDPNVKELGLVGRSLMETVYILYRNDMASHANSLMKRFKIPFNQYWRCRIAALCEVQNINELIKMSTDKTAQAQQNTVKIGNGAIDIVIDALVSLGATSSVENLVATLKPQHQQQWRNKLNERAGGTDQQEDASILSKLSQRLWS